VGHDRLEVMMIECVRDLADHRQRVIVFHTSSYPRRFRSGLRSGEHVQRITSRTDHVPVDSLSKVGHNLTLSSDDPTLRIAHHRVVDRAATKPLGPEDVEGTATRCHRDDRITWGRR
jgi:hypothetical protein